MKYTHLVRCRRLPAVVAMFRTCPYAPASERLGQHREPSADVPIAGQLAVAHRRADLDDAAVGDRDRVERQVGHVDEPVRAFDLELHQIDEVRAATEHGATGRGVERRQRLVDAARSLVGERSHRPATSTTASMMLTYAPQRHRFPLIRSRISAGSEGPRLGALGGHRAGHPAAISPSMPTAEQICPGVQ